MSDRGTTLLLLLILGGAALALWALLATGGGVSGAVVAGPPGAGGGTEGTALGGPDDVDRTPESDDEDDRVALEEAAPPPTPAAWEEGFDEAAVYATVREEGEGPPIAGAEVALYPMQEDEDELDQPLEVTTTNADGRFRFLGLDPLTSYQVFVTAEGFRPDLEGVSTGTDEDIELRPGATFGGRVLDANTTVPIEGAEVWIWLENRGPGGIEDKLVSLTGADGAYTLEHARLDRLQDVWVRAPGRLAEKREFQVRPEGGAGYDILLEPGVGLVLAPYDVIDGAPLRDVELRLSNGLELATDGNGDLRLTSPGRNTLDEGVLQLDVRAEGWCRTSVRVDLAGHDRERTVAVPMYRGATLTGRVHDPEGDPIPGARVWLSNRNRSIPGVQLPERTWIRTARNRTRADDRGVFTLDGIVPGTREMRLTASAPDYPSGNVSNIALAGPETRTQDIELARGSLVVGTVSHNGEPVSARVSWRADQGSGSARSNDAGSYRLRGVRASLVKISADEDDGMWSGRDEAEEVWIEDGTTTVHDIAITTNKARIAGIVRDSLGAPVAGVEVSGWAEDEGRGEWSYASDTTEADGTFTLSVVDAPGVTYQLWAQDGPRNANVANVPVGGEGIEIVLPMMGKIALEVVDALTRESVQGFRIYWREAGSDGFRALRNGDREFSPGPDGVFEAELPAGQVDLRITARDQGYVAASLDNALVSEETPRRSRVEMDRGVTVEFTFRGADPAISHKKLGRLTVISDTQLAELGGGGGWNSYDGREIRGAQRIRLDGEGRGVLKAMAPGSYTFLDPPDHAVFEPKRFDVPHVDVHTVTIDWSLTKGGDAEASAAATLKGIGYFGND